MREEVREKLLGIYDSITEKARAVEQVFIDQFGEEYVDSSLPTFDEFVASFDNDTLGSVGINAWRGSNEHGSYTIISEDYEQNGRGKKLFEYIPDLGILDYLTDIFKLRISQLSCDDPIADRVYIIIRFPKVKVTNEYDKSIDISELYVRVTITFYGRMVCRFEMTRAEYTVIQWISDYAHSHLPGIERNNPERFRPPCTGSGPINRTIGTLQTIYDLNIWGLFTFELSKFVTVESISGVPHRRLENVGKNNNIENTASIQYTDKIPYSATYTTKQLANFVKDFLSNEVLKISFKNGNYTLGESFNDFWLRVSNAFIRWHNDNVKRGESRFTISSLMASGLLNKYLMAEGVVYAANQYQRMNQVAQYEGRELFKFKGQMVRLHFIGGVQNNNTTYLVKKELCFYILTKAIEIISCNYGRENTEEADESKPHPRCFHA